MRITRWLGTLIVLLLFSNCTFSQQLSLGNTPYFVNKSAVLELNSDKQGLLFPRINDTTVINALTPPDGMVIYFVPTKQLLLRSNGSWQSLTLSGSLNNYWSVSGNTNGSAKKIGTTDNFELPFITNNLERFRISAAGNIGIANTNPSEKLDITGNLKFSGALMPGGSAGTIGYVLTSSGAGVAPTWQDGNAFITNLSWLQNGNNLTALRNFGTTSNFALPFITNNVERMRLTTSGFLGIGTTVPSTALHVVGANPLTLVGVQDGTITSADSILTITSGLVKKIPVSSFQSPINGTGFVKASGTTVSYDNNSYTVANTAITGGTKTKITYDSKGLVTAGTDATTTDIGEGTNLYFTDTRVRSTALTGLSTATTTAVTAGDNLLAGLGKLQGQINNINSAGYLTGNQTVTLSGDVSGSGTTAITTAIGANKVTLAHMAQVGTGTFLGRTTAATGNVEAMSIAQAKTMLGLTGTNSGDITLGGQNYLSLSGQTITANAVDLSGTHATGTLAAARFGALTGDVTNTAGSYATTITNGAVSYAKMQNISANNRLLGRATTGAGSPEEIIIGSGLALTGNTLSATASANQWNTIGNSGINASLNFLGTTDDKPMILKSFNQSFLEFGNRGTLGLTQGGFTDYDDATEKVTHIRSAMQFEAAGAQFYKPKMYIDANGNFRIKGSSAGTDYFEMGSTGTNNNGGFEFIIGDDGDEPMVFKSYHYINGMSEIMRLQSGRMAVGSNAFDATNPEKLLIDAGTTNSYNLMTGKGSIDNYLQINVQNRSNGGSASSDLVATANNGSESDKFIDMGINSGGYTNTTYPVLGGANTTYLYGTGADMVIGNGTANQNLRFFTGGFTNANERLRIDGTGDVGINNLNPAEKLDVTGNVRFSGALMPGGAAGTAGQVLQSNGAGSAPTWVTSSNSSNTWIHGGNTLSATQKFGTISTHDLPIITSNTERMRFFSTGGVAIGTTSLDATNPEELLVDAGNTSSINVISGKGSINNYLQLNIQNRSVGSAASSDIVATADNGNESVNFVDLGINSSNYSNAGVLGGANNAYLYSTGNDFIIGNATSAKALRFFTGGTATGNERMRIDGSGNIGIGTTSPSDKLSVAGIIAPSADATYTLGKTTARWTFIYATSGFVSSSDRRLKTNINNLNYGLKEVIALQPVRYNWKKDSLANPRLGLIAQDVRKLVPEVVLGDEEKETLSINYPELIPVLINAIKEQQKQIEGLRQQRENDKASLKELDELKQQMKALSERMKKVEKN